MGHTKPADLKDLQDILESLRGWDGIKEKSPNVFYYRSKPFLHFHDKDGRRWADVRCGEDMEKSLEIPFRPTPGQKSGFFKAVAQCYKALLR